MVRQPASQRAVAQNEINKDNMKIIRNIARRPWPRIGGWLPVMMLICGVLASCSSEDESTAPLPDGKYPLQLTAEVAQPQTRAGGKDAWTGGEEIRVSLEGVFGNKTYVMTHRAMQARRMPIMPSIGRTPMKPASVHGPRT